MQISFNRSQMMPNTFGKEFISEVFVSVVLTNGCYWKKNETVENFDERRRERKK